MNQLELLYKFSVEKRPKFNPELFHKSDSDIIENLKLMIKSCERDRNFIIKAVNFEVITDYDECKRIIEDNSVNKIKKDGETLIYIKDSYLKVLKVTYYIEAYGESDNVDVYIAVPRILEGAYLNLSGNIYFPLFQLVDSSTYNNTGASTAKDQTITLKSISAAIRMVKDNLDINSTGGHVIKANSFSLNLFNKKIYAFVYYFAKYGFYGGLNYFGFDGYINIIEDALEDDDRRYCFRVMKSKRIFTVRVDKFMMDNDKIFQSMVVCVLHALDVNIKPRGSLNSIFEHNFWLEVLGSHISKSSASVAFNKGNSLLYSLECSYDDITKRHLKLPDHLKEDIFCIIKWMMFEFNNIRQKRNTDVLGKRIRWAEWIASLYIMKLNPALYRISDRIKPNSKDNLKKIRQAIKIQPLYLISQIQKSELKGFRNMVNDRDAFLQLKYSIKGPSGPGESNSKNLSNSLKMVDISHIGNIDMTTSAPNAPGVTGMLCPLNRNIFENGQFSNEEEPNTWEEAYKSLLNDYYNSFDIQDLIVEENVRAEVAYNASKLAETIRLVEYGKPYYDGICIPLEESGLVYFKYE